MEAHGCGYERVTLEGFCDGNVLYLECIDVSILVVILYYSFARYYHWKKLGKGYKKPLCIVSYNCM